MLNNQQITILVEKQLKKYIDPNKIKVANALAAQKLIDIIRDRTSKGLDKNYKRMPAKKFDYKIGKYVKIPNYWKRKATDLQSLLKGKSTTGFKANKYPNHGRLTGELFSDMSFLVTQFADFGNKISASFRIFVRERSAKKLEWLKSTTGATRWKGVYGGQFYSTKSMKKRTYTKPSRDIWGLSDNATKRENELNQVRETFLKGLGINPKSVMIKVK